MNMPLLLHKHLEPKLELGLWQITEEETWFTRRLDFHPREQSHLDRMKGRKRVEYLASRQLVHVMSGRKKRGVFLKDEFGKPHLENSPYQISLSHSHGMTAVLAGPYDLGIDIQKMTPKIASIAERFLTEDELSCISVESFFLEHLHVFWGAKEALYKAYGRRSLDFCKHLWVKPFSYHPHIGFAEGVVQKNGYEKTFEIRYEIVLQEYMLVYAWEAME